MTYLKDNISFEPIPTSRIGGHPFRDLTHQIFSYLIVLGYAGKTGKIAYWWCECECGVIKKITGVSLKTQGTLSCRHWRRKRLGDARRTHGETPINQPHSAEYKAFEGAKQRCNNPTNKDYAKYGGRGIEFRFDSFEAFLTEVGRKPFPKLTLDRKNVNGHYESGNLRWATQLEQQRNRRNRKEITIDNITHCISEWEELLNVPKGRTGNRLRLGWCPSCAVTLASRQHCPHR